MSELRFHASDFKILRGREAIYPDPDNDDDFDMVERDKIAADIANARLDEMLRDAPKVFKCVGYGHYDKWIEDESELDAAPSHRAKLVQVQEIK